MGYPMKPVNTMIAESTQVWRDLRTRQRGTVDPAAAAKRTELLLDEIARVAQMVKEDALYGGRGGHARTRMFGDLDRRITKLRQMLDEAQGLTAK